MDIDTAKKFARRMFGKNGNAWITNDSLLRNLHEVGVGNGSFKMAYGSGSNFAEAFVKASEHLQQMRNASPLTLNRTRKE